MLDKLLRVLLKPKKPLTVKEKLDSVLPPVRIFVPYKGPVRVDPGADVEISTDLKVCRMSYLGSAFPFSSKTVWERLPNGERYRIWPGAICFDTWRRVDCVKVGDKAYWWADFDWPTHGEGSQDWDYRGKYAPTAKEALNVR